MKPLTIVALNWPYHTICAPFVYQYIQCTLASSTSVTFGLTSLSIVFAVTNCMLLQPLSNSFLKYRGMCSREISNVLTSLVLLQINDWMIRPLLEKNVSTSRRRLAISCAFVLVSKELICPANSFSLSVALPGSLLAGG